MEKAEEVYDLKTVNIDDLLTDIFEYLIELDGKDDFTEDAEKESSIITSTESKGKTTKNIDYSNKSTIAKRKLYFNGEGDNNQSKYEKLANHLQIATTAKTEIVGLALHTFLRMTIDEHKRNWFTELYGFVGGDEIMVSGKMKIRSTYTLKEIVEVLVESNKDYSSTHNLDDGVYVNTILSGYNGKTKINRFVGDINVYDVYHLGQIFGVLDDNDQYKF